MATVKNYHRFTELGELVCDYCMGIGHFYVHRRKKLLGGYEYRFECSKCEDDRSWDAIDEAEKQIEVEE